MVPQSMEHDTMGVSVCPLPKHRSCSHTTTVYQVSDSVAGFGTPRPHQKTFKPTHTWMVSPFCLRVIKRETL